MLKRVLSAYGLGVFGAAAPCAAHVAALLGGVMLPADHRPK